MILIWPLLIRQNFNNWCVVAIPGTTTVQHLQENLQAAQLKLEGQTIQKLDFISKNFQGARMSEADMQGSFRHAKWD